MAERTSERFRALLKAHRKRLGWSQERLAVEADMDHSLVSRLESGQRSATRDNIARLARGAGWADRRGLNLTDAERDELLIAAGFRPNNPAAMVATVPEAARLYSLLSDDGALGAGARVTLRRLVSDAMSMAEAVTAKGG